jgi:uncharacterized repeat protein (TIGR03803 family)
MVTSKGKHQGWMLEANSGRASAVLTLALALLLTVVGTLSAQAQTYSVLYSFTGGADGAYPYAGVILDKAGNLYGTTFQGGDPNKCATYPGCGVVYKLDSAGKETVLHTFKGSPDGQEPDFGNLLQDKAGNLYGTTVYGGNVDGVVFKISSADKEAILHSFPQQFGDAECPQGALVQNAAGDLYGTTFAGGTSSCSAGTVFKISKAGKESVVHSFNGYDGFGPVSTLVRDAAGNFYGTTTSGGSIGYGTVFKVSKAGKFSVLYNFKGPPDGYLPEGPLVLDDAGNLYGMTYEGGNANACPGFGCGIVFKLNKKGKETILHTFLGPDGAGPMSGVLLDAAGNLYGTTWAGGAHDSGSIFKLEKAGNLTTLYDFTGGTDGGYPFAGLTQDKAGNFYGTASLGGITKCESGCGVVFKLTP